MLPQGKGMFIHQGAACGRLKNAIDAAREMGIKWVALKVADGADTQYASYPDMLSAASAFRAVGIDVWGWQYLYGGVRWDAKREELYNYGASPEDEAALAKIQVSKLHLSGYIMDPEKEYKGLNQQSRALRFGAALAGIGVPVALCSYRYPTLHQELPWNEFLSFANFHMPQVYWNPPLAGAGRGPMPELDRSMQELFAQRDLPIVPVGRAYVGDGHADPRAQELLDFLTAARGNGCSGAGFWVLDHIVKYGSERNWPAMIRDFAWPVANTPAPGWRQAITAWARSQGYRGPDPE